MPEFIIRACGPEDKRLILIPSSRLSNGLKHDSGSGFITGIRCSRGVGQFYGGGERRWAVPIRRQPESVAVGGRVKCTCLRAHKPVAEADARGRTRARCRA